MRSLLLLVGATVLLLAPRAEAQCTGTAGTDFQQVTIREINAIPQTNVDFLVTNAATLTPAQIIENITANPLQGATVEFTAYVMTDPYDSGLASINSSTGIPNRIHVFVRDVAAATEGPAGQTIQIVDGRTDNGATLGLFIGDEITVCGTVSPFNNTTIGSSSMQITPISITPTNNAVTEDDPVLDPVTITTDDIHNIVNGATQIDWTQYGDFNGQYVRFEGIEVVQGVAAPTGRPDVLFSSPGQETQINQYDTSLRFRNDRAGSYPNPPYNTRAADNPFTPPPTGTVNLQGFLLFAGDDGTFAYSSPARANFVVNPFTDDDFEIAGSPPIVTVLDTAIPSPSAGAQVRVTAEAGTPGATVASVVANYTTSAGGSGSVSLSNTTGDEYAGTITGLSAGDFVTYTITATDNEGAASVSSSVTRRVVDGPVSSIFDIQVTADGGVGGSAITTAVPVAFDLDAVVQTAFQGSTSSSETGYFVTIQDDPTLGPFSGVYIFFGATDPSLAPGDRINISQARVNENFGVTRLVDVTFTEGTPGDPYPAKVMTTDLFSGVAGAETAEQHEGMLLRFESNVTIASANPDVSSGDFGEFSFTTDGGTTSLRVDDASDAIPVTFNDDLTPGQAIESIEGALFYTFNNYKLFPPTLDAIAFPTAVGTGPGEARVGIVGSFPNPTAGTARVRFELATAGDVSLRLFDLMGREVAVVAQGTFAAASHDVAADLGGLAAGVYVLRLEAAGDVATARIAVVR